MNTFSYKYVYELCIKPDAKIDEITQKFAPIFNEKNLFNIADHEYAYALFTVNSELYNMETYFKNADAILTLAHLLTDTNFELAMQTFEFIRKFDFMRCTLTQMPQKPLELND